MIEPYQPRPLEFLGIENLSGYQLKLYSIRYGEQPVDRERFVDCLDLATSHLPRPSIAPSRPGVGFAILHQGRTGDYLILCWWDNENELPTRVFVNDSEGWRPARGSESFCVWDLRVIWWEREAYIATVLANCPDSVEVYLGMSASGFC